MMTNYIYAIGWIYVVIILFELYIYKDRTLDNQIQRLILYIILEGVMLRCFFMI